MSEKVINIRDNLIKVYLDWMNNFITIPAFADYYGVTEDEAKKIIEIGRKLHNRCVGVKV